ncbi:MAG: FecR domain-containing protein [Pseudomonadota bacterium]
MGQGNNNGPRPDERYSHPDPATDEALDWFLRFQDVGRDPATQAEFERWIAGDPRRREAFERLQRMHAMPSLRKATERDAARLDPIAGPRTTTAMRSRIRSWPGAWGIAAAAAVLLAIVMTQVPSLILRWQADYLTASGEIRRVRLPDGSEMTLNTASAVALDFKQGRRQVRLLAGEVFLDVKTVAGQPFIVAAPVSEVEVKGTGFAVRTDDERDTVVLERGLVDVRRSGDRFDRVALKPGEMVTASAIRISRVTAVDVNASLAWLGGRIVFRDQPFDNALDELRRYYDGTVIVATGRFSATMVSGNYRVGDPQAAIRTLAESVDASMTSLPGGIIILR